MLAAGALIASILAIGASPAAAAAQNADAQAPWKACVGPAMESRGFTDVDMGSVHYDNINCLAYYGITTGKTADTYDPQSSVTRSQMALFLTRMATAAGVDLGDVMDAGFSDLGMTDAERVSAINRLAAKGIMEGRTATTFDPEGTVTRADMAQHLFAFIDLALDSVSIDRVPATVDGDGTGIEVKKGVFVDDYFGDARRSTPAHVDEIIGAVYELGITTGTNGMVGASGTFEPAAPVTRAQMASFIMRTLSHTNLRPAGITAQQNSDGTRVSVRTADFKPVADAPVELFTTEFADDVFDARGECISHYVSDGGRHGHIACEIDPGDAETDAQGNHMFSVAAAGSKTKVCSHTLEARAADDPDSEYGAWVWTGAVGDTFDRDTARSEPMPGNDVDSPNPPASAALTGGTSFEAKKGSTVTYTVQLLDADGAPVGPDPNRGDSFRVEIERIDVGADGNRAGGDDDVLGLTRTTEMPDSNGRVVIPLTQKPTKGNDVIVDVTVTPQDPDGTGPLTALDFSAARADSTSNNATVLGTTPTGVHATVLFSEDAATAGSYTVSTRTWGRHNADSGGLNQVTFTVLDQYGKPTSKVAGTATVDGADVTKQFGIVFTVGDASYNPRTGATTAPTGTVRSDGIARVTYRSPSTTRTDTLPGTPGVVLSGESVDADFTSAIATSIGNITAPSGSDVETVYWASAAITDVATASNAVLVADPGARTIVAGPADGSTSMSYVFGTDDTFIVNHGGSDTALTYAQFVEVLAAMNDRSITSIVTAGATLASDGYDPARPRDRAEWTLTLVCG